MSQTFFLRLLPPRPTFATDMSDEERALMGQHVAYVRRFFDEGKVLMFGPVLDPEGAFGIAVLQAESQAEVDSFIANDPTVAPV